MGLRKFTRSEKVEVLAPKEGAKLAKEARSIRECAVCSKKIDPGHRLCDGCLQSS